MRNQPRGASHGRERYLRSHATPAEQKLWSALRMSRSFKFRRQHRIGDLIVDFYCAEARLAIEIDGSIHDSDLAADRALRDERLRSHEVQVVHFNNGEVMMNVADVVRRIEDLCCFS